MNNLFKKIKDFIDGIKTISFIAGCLISLFSAGAWRGYELIDINEHRIKDSTLIARINNDNCIFRQEKDSLQQIIDSLVKPIKK